MQNTFFSSASPTAPQSLDVSAMGEWTILLPPDAADETERSRVEKAALCAYRARVDTGAWESAPDRDTLIDGYIRLSRKHGVTHVAEHKEAEAFFEELRDSGQA